MSFFGDIANTIGGAVSNVRRAADDAVKTTKATVADVARTVTKEVGHAASGAKQAVEGVQAAVHKVAGDAGKAAASIDSTVKQGISDSKAALNKVVPGAGDVASNVGGWLWENKGEIGFWVGTSALIAATPLSGGASTAAAGGLMAARGAALATKVAEAGKVGATAMKLARSAADAVQGARGAAAATKVGGAVVNANKGVAGARLALGQTGVGKGLIAAQKPIGAAALGLGVVNLAETAGKVHDGTANVGDLALSAIGVVPGVAATAKGVAARQATKVDKAAADIVADKLGGVASSTAAASRQVHAIAHGAPDAVAATPAARIVADVAGSAADTARAADLVRREASTAAAAATTPNAVAGGAAAAPVVRATDLKQQVDTVIGQTGAVRQRLEAARAIAPAELAPVTSSALAQLDHAVSGAEHASDQLAGLATTSARANAIADAAAATKQVGDVTAGYADYVANVRDGISIAGDVSGGAQGTGVLTKERDLGQALVTNLFKLNARTGVPKPQPAAAAAAN